MSKKIMFLGAFLLMSIVCMNAKQEVINNAQLSQDLLSELDEINKKPVNPQEEKLKNQLDEIVSVLISEDKFKNAVDQNGLSDDARALLVEMQETSSKIEQLKANADFAKQERMMQEISKILEKKMKEKKNLSEQEINQFTEKAKQMCPLVIHAVELITRLQEIQSHLLEKLMEKAMKTLLEVKVK